MELSREEALAILAYFEERPYPRLIDDLRAKTSRIEKPHFVPERLIGEWQKIVRRTHQTLAWPELPCC